MTSAFVPRPIAFVSTRSLAGVDNCAPFSYSMGVSRDPMVLAVSIGERDGQPKDSARTSWIPACSSSTWLRRESPKDEPSLGGLCGIRQRVRRGGPHEGPRGGRAGGSNRGVAREFRMPPHSGHPGRGQHRVPRAVVRLHVRDDVLNEGLVDVRKVHAIGRLGGRRYCHAQDVFEVMRPRVTGPKSARPTDAR